MLRLRCPSCRHSFPCSDDKKGRSVACPSCNEKFIAEETETGVKATPPKPAAGGRKSRKDGDEETTSPRKVPAKSGGSGALIALLLGGAAVLVLGVLVVGGGVAFFALRSPRDAAKPQAVEVAAVAEKQEPPAKPVIAPEKVEAPAQKFNLAETRKSVVFLRVFAPGLPPATGSGFFVTQDGLIATNRHVVEGEDGIPPGAKIVAGVPRPNDPDTLDFYQAELAYVTPKNDPTDFALVKIKAGPNSAPFRPLPLVAKDAIALGAEVAALGYPFAVADDDKVSISFTKGCISSTKVAFDNKSFYQTDAAVNPGNSGGPLVNANGEVVGIVTLQRKNADNMGFALYLGETNLRNLPVQQYANVKPAPGPLAANARPTLRTLAAKRANWNLERGQAKEMKTSVVLQGDNLASSFWVTNNNPLPDNFQVSFVTVLAGPEDKGGGVMMVQPGIPRPKGSKLPPRPPVIIRGGSAPPLLAIRLTSAATNNDILAGDGLTFLQSPQSVQARINGQGAGQNGNSHVDGVFIVTLLRSGNTVSYFVNGKEQLRTTLPAGAANLRMSVGGARGLVVLTDLYVEQYSTPVNLAALPNPQPIVQGNPKPGQQPPPVNLGGVDGATKIVGGAFDPNFKDEAPKGGLLVGLDIGVVNNSIKAIRPIYRVGNQESQGTPYGKNRPGINIANVRAKDGYAVGSITVNAGLWIDGMSITFMRIKGDGTLDPNDSYQSPYYGGNGGGRSTLGGNGVPVVGIIGKHNANDCTGFGLLLKR